MFWLHCKSGVGLVLFHILEFEWKGFDVNSSSKPESLVAVATLCGWSEEPHISLLCWVICSFQVAIPHSQEIKRTVVWQCRKNSGSREMAELLEKNKTRAVHFRHVSSLHFSYLFFNICINFSREEIHSIACQRDITRGTQLVHKEADIVFKFSCSVLP